MRSAASRVAPRQLARRCQGMIRVSNHIRRPSRIHCCSTRIECSECPPHRESMTSEPGTHPRLASPRCAAPTFGRSSSTVVSQSCLASWRICASATPSGERQPRQTTPRISSGLTLSLRLIVAQQAYARGREWPDRPFDPGSGTRQCAGDSCPVAGCHGSRA